jgi:hypothetical protein
MEDEIEKLQQRCELLECLVVDLIDTFLIHDEGVDGRLITALENLQKEFEKAQNTL